MATMRRAAWALVVLLGFSTSACGDGDGGGSVGSADCVLQIKDDGVVFASYGYTGHAASEYGVALEADCEDVGLDARGSVFTDESRRVTTYRFAGYPPAEVLGVRYREDTGFAVFVAESVGKAERDRIYQELADDQVHPPDAAVASSDSVDELSQHNGEFCPTVLPRASRETYGFGDDRPAASSGAISRVSSLRFPRTHIGIAERIAAGADF